MTDQPILPLNDPNAYLASNPSLISVNLASWVCSCRPRFDEQIQENLTVSTFVITFSISIICMSDITPVLCHMKQVNWIYLFKLYLLIYTSGNRLCMNESWARIYKTERVEGHDVSTFYKVKLTDNPSPSLTLWKWVNSNSDQPTQVTLSCSNWTYLVR